MIKIDAGLCLGCLSCSNVCPSQNIVRTETADKRSLHWKRCKEECDLCVAFCPAKALTLVPFDETVPENDVYFDTGGLQDLQIALCHRAHAEENRIHSACQHAEGL